MEVDRSQEGRGTLGEKTSLGYKGERRRRAPVGIGVRRGR